MRAALYLRVSTTRQAEQDLSIPDQRRQAEAFATRKGWQVAVEYEEAGASATDDKRPAFQRMIEDAKKNPRPFDVVVVHSFSRFFRDAFQSEMYIRQLKKAGVKLISITQETSDDPNGHLVRNILALFDEHSSQENAKHTLRGMQENARQGFWNGSRPPFGYRTIEAERRGDKIKKRLEIEPREAELVRQIFTLYLDGDGARALGVKGIADRLNRLGVRYREARRFSTGLVYKLLTRTSYIGDHYFNQTDSKTFKEKPEKEWIHVSVSPILDADRFHAAQAKLKQNNPRKIAPRIVNGPTLLTGLLFCATCGGGMTLRTGKANKYRYYACSTSQRMGKTVCAGRIMPMVTIDNLVTDHLSRRLFAPDRLKALLSAQIKRAKHGQTTSLEKVKALRAEIRETEKAQARLYEAIEKGIASLDDDTLRQRLSELKAKREDCLRLISSIERRNTGPVAVLSAAKIDAFGRAMQDRLKNPDSAHRKAYIRLHVARIDLDDNELRMYGPKESLQNAIENPEDLAKLPVRSFVREWRAEGDSNPT
jgi:site-specific DNA recombinase